MNTSTARWFGQGKRLWRWSRTGSHEHASQDTATLDHDSTNPGNETSHGLNCFMNDFLALLAFRR